ncbi:adenylylsulfate kinase [Pseudomonas putida]|nr:adenylylsulfate kinase [Pseudomonas putida]
MNTDNTGQVVWITGLSGAGKSTLARELADGLRGQGRSVILLDGDELREVFGTTTDQPQNFGRDGRLTLAMRYAQLCRVIAAQGHVVVIATISLFHEVHAWNRAHLPGYFEIYLKVPLEELRRRDPKHIYKRFDAGELHNVAGLDLPIDEPSAPDWVAVFEPNRSPRTLAVDCLHSFNKRKPL